MLETLAFRSREPIDVVMTTTPNKHVRRAYWDTKVRGRPGTGTAARPAGLAGLAVRGRVAALAQRVGRQVAWATRRRTTLQDGEARVGLEDHDGAAGRVGRPVDLDGLGPGRRGTGLLADRGRVGAAGTE